MRSAASGSARRWVRLVTCPCCLGLWVATGFGFGLVLRPDATRWAALVFSTVAGADVRQLAYSAIEQQATE